MDQGMGRMIQELREKSGYTQEDLCRGLCSLSELAKIETDRVIPGYFELDRLFGRLGESTERLEYVLPKEIYELYEFQYLIQVHILRREYSEAENLLSDYEHKKKADLQLHKQFIEQERAQIARLRGKACEEILHHLNIAIQQTMEGQELLLEGSPSKSALSAEELKLLLFRWEVCHGTKEERPDYELEDLLYYIEHKQMNLVEKAKVYPYAVLLWVKFGNKEKEPEKCISLLKEAFGLLCKQSQLLYMDEMIEEYIHALNIQDSRSGDIEQFGKMRKSLREVEREFGIDYQNYRLFQYMNRAFELDYELIRNGRIAGGLSQEALSEEICARETLSRVERGLRQPSHKNLERLLKHLKRERKRINTILITEKYEVIVWKRQLARYLQKREYDKAEEVLNRLEHLVDSNIIENKQYIMAEKVRMKVQNKQYDKAQAITELEEILRFTLDWKEEEEIVPQLSVIESNILNQIAMYHCKKKEKEAQRGIQIWKNILMNYEKSRVLPVFRIRQWELYVSNLGIVYEETESFQEALAYAKKAIEAALTLGKGGHIGSSLEIIACVLEKEKDVRCRQRFAQVMHFYKLTDSDKKCQVVEDWLKTSEFYQKISH